MKTLLVPIDFSPESDVAIDVAGSIASRVNSRVVILHVIESGDGGSFNVEGQADTGSGWDNRLFTLKMIQKARKQLTGIQARMEKSGIRTQSVLRMGNPFHGMQSIISEQGADLVVMGTKGSNGLAELLIGSNTEKVVRRSRCPVLSVSKKPKRMEFKSIVWATGLSKSERPFVNVVTNTQELYGATIHLVRINTPGAFISDALVMKKLEALAKEWKLKDYTLNSFNDYTEEEGIIHFADNVDADLIAMPTHGRTGLAHLVDGSIAEDVVNHARRPVLTYGLKNSK